MAITSQFTPYEVCSLIAVAVAVQVDHVDVFQKRVDDKERCPSSVDTMRNVKEGKREEEAEAKVLSARAPERGKRQRHHSVQDFPRS